MTLSINEIAQMRETVAKILDELLIDAYLFEIEPQEGQWEVKVECPLVDGWETVHLTAKKEYLQRGGDDAVIHQLLLDDWGEALSACKPGRD